MSKRILTVAIPDCFPYHSYTLPHTTNNITECKDGKETWHSEAGLDQCKQTGSQRQWFHGKGAGAGTRGKMEIAPRTICCASNPSGAQSSPEEAERSGGEVYQIERSCGTRTP